MPKRVPDRGVQFLGDLAPHLNLDMGAQRLVPLRIVTSLIWVMLGGQGASLAIVFFRSGTHPNLLYGLAVLAVLSLGGLYLQNWWRHASNNRAWITNGDAAWVLALLLIQTTLFLAVTGGVLNPFVVLLFAPIMVSATSLGKRATHGLVLLGIILLSLITFAYLDLPWRNRTGEIGSLILPLDYRAAIWTALVISLVFLTLFISWQSDLARKTTRAFEASRVALDRETALANIGGLAAAAAHELGTPLSTIAVTARELADMLSEQDAPPDMIEDAQLLVEETERCSQIIAQLSAPAHGQGSHEPFLRRGLGDILDTLVKAQDRAHIAYTFTQDSQTGDAEPMLPSQAGLIHALANLVQNAFQFAHSQVQAHATWDESQLTLRLTDDGPGFPPGLIDRLGQPYVQGPKSDRPSMGLGLFIATSLLRHVQATVTFSTRSDGQRGAEVSVSWDLPISDL